MKRKQDDTSSNYAIKKRKNEDETDYLSLIPNDMICCIIEFCKMEKADVVSEAMLRLTCRRLHNLIKPYDISKFIPRSKIFPDCDHTHALYPKEKRLPEKESWWSFVSAYGGYPKLVEYSCKELNSKIEHSVVYMLLLRECFSEFSYLERTGLVVREDKPTPEAMFAFSILHKLEGAIKDLDNVYDTMYHDWGLEYVRFLEGIENPMNNELYYPLLCTKTAILRNRMATLFTPPYFLIKQTHVDVIAKQLTDQDEVTALKILYSSFQKTTIDDIIQKGLYGDVDLLDIIHKGEKLRYDFHTFRYGNEERMMQLISRLINLGYMDCIEYLQSKEYPVEKFCATAAECGRLQILEYLHRCGGNMDEDVLLKSIQGGHTECFVYAFDKFPRDFRPSWDHNLRQRLVEKVLQFDRSDMLKYALYQNIGISSDVLPLAIHKHAQKCVELLKAHFDAQTPAPLFFTK
jgi:hypothetical protein